MHNAIFFVLFSVNCEYESWENWTPCSKPCAGGDQNRQRGIKIEAKFGGTNCSGDTEEIQSCNTQNCPSTCK